MSESTSQKPIRDYKDLHVWQKAMELAKRIYLLTGRFPPEEKFGLVSQMRRAAISVPSNIAEGYERTRPREFHRFLCIAKASCAELRTQLYIAADVGYITEEHLRELLDTAEEVGRVIGGLRATVARKANPTHHSSLITHH